MSKNINKIPMDKNKFHTLQKKANAKMTNTMSALIVGLIVVVLATALAPEMFSNIAGLEGETDVPEWVPVVLYLIVGAGLVFLIWRVFLN